MKVVLKQKKKVFYKMNVINNILGKTDSNIIMCEYCGGDGLDENMKTCKKCLGAGSYHRDYVR